MSTSEKSSQTISVTQRAAEQISRLIFNGDLIADCNYLESELADRLGISRTPVREATITLHARGLLEIQPRKGVRIAAMTQERIGDAIDVICELECLAARQAATAVHTENQLAPLLQSMQAIEKAIRNTDVFAWAASDEIFHIRLVELSNNSTILSTLKTLYDQIRRARNVALKSMREPIKSGDHYHLIYNAILTNNANAADQAHREYRQASRQILIETLQR